MPIAPGSLICNGRWTSHGGTLGCFVQSATDPSAVYLLTAGHVIGMNGYAQHGDPILAQRADGSWIMLASFEATTPLHDVSGAVQVCDAAIARITDTNLVDPAIPGIGQPLRTSTGLFPGMDLQLCGAGSGGLVQATLRSFGEVVDVGYEDAAGGPNYALKFADQVYYGSQAGGIWSPCTKPCDSGALVVNGYGMAVGLHFAVTPDEDVTSASICTPIGTVLQALGVRLLGAAPLEAADQVGVASFAALGVSLRSALEPHNPYGGVSWQLTPHGVVVDGSLERTPGALVTVPRVWERFGALVTASCAAHGVPIELVVATICVESSGNPDAVRIEPGYTSDAATPRKVSVGLMQTLIDTANGVVKPQVVDRAALQMPATSIEIGTRYIAEAKAHTQFDPPLVACAYNHGSLASDDRPGNRWRIMQTVTARGAYADTFTQFFNDCMAYFAQDRSRVPANAPSFTNLLT